MKPANYLTFCLIFLFGIWNVSMVELSSGLHFNSGVLYEYEYSTSMLIAPISVDLEKVPAITVEAVIQVHSVWRHSNNQHEQLLQIKIQDVKLNPSTSNHFVDKEIKEPFLVHIYSGQIQGVLDISLDNTVSLNFKKGIASLFQVQASSGVMMENDTTGHCQVSYYTRNNDILKTKNYENCQKKMNDGMLQANQIFGVKSDGRSETVFTVVDGHIKSVKSEEFHSLVLDEQPVVGIHLSSRQQLHLLTSNSGTDNEAQGELKEVLSSLKVNFVNHTVHATPSDRKPAFNKYPVSKLLNQLKIYGLHATQSATTNVFLHLSESLQYLKKTEIKNIFKSNAKFMPILIDAAAAASTPASLNAFVSSINFTNPKTSPLLEKFLYACAFSSQPSTHLISTISHILSQTSAQWKTHEIALIVLGTVIRKMCAADMCHVKEVKHAKRIILKGLSASKDKTEIKSHLLALKSARLPETIPVLLQYIDQGKSLSSIVLSALQDIPSEYITEEVKERLRDIFTRKEKLFSAPVRLEAIHLLLKHNPLYTDVREIILKIAKEKPEISKFITNKIMSLLQSDNPARKVIIDVLKDSKLNNYFHLARLGYSSSFAGLMLDKKDVVTSYDFDFLFSESGTLKQSNSHIYTQTGERRLHLLQVSLETGGLEALLGSEPTEEEEELMAGMSAMFLGVHIQPTIFFQGYSDLISKYFSADGGPMKILSGNILVLDHRQSIILQSGLEAQAVFHGGISVDVSADVAFSLFSQDSKTAVDNKFSLVVSARGEVDSLHRSAAAADTVVDLDSSVSVVTTVNFSEMPVKYCLQLIREPLLFRERVKAQISDKQQNKTVHQRKQKWILPGEETALHKDNSKMCTSLLGQNEI